MTYADFQTYSHLPTRSYRVIIGNKALDQFVAEVKKFSSANALTMDIAQTSPNKGDFMMKLQRDDVKILVGNAFSPNDIRISFYANQTNGISPDALDKVINSLKTFVPGIADDPKIAAGH